MTTEERLDRIEHLTAGIAEERRKDREEYKALWRDTQRQLNEVSIRLVQLSEADSRLEARIDQVNQQLGARIEEFAKASKEANKDLQERIASVVSGFGAFIAENKQK